jgi:hypothetical protein
MTMANTLIARTYTAWPACSIVALDVEIPDALPVESVGKHFDFWRFKLCADTGALNCVFCNTGMACQIVHVGLIPMLLWLSYYWTDIYIYVCVCVCVYVYKIFICLRQPSDGSVTRTFVSFRVSCIIISD